MKSSKGASISSRIQKGAGFKEKKENTKAIDESAFSPPESCDTFTFFLPGGIALKTIPVSKMSSEVVSN